jgi:GTP-binding protein Era
LTEAAGPAGTGRCGVVAVTGWTNVGKSTLVNRLVGEKVAAVSAAPQTTRNRITGVLTLPGRAQAVFLDTPGFHRPQHRLNRAMVETARQSLTAADVVVLVVDAARGLGPGDEDAARRVRSALPAPYVAVLNKVDAVAPKSRLLPQMDTLVRAWGADEAIPVSALTGEGCDVLLDRLVARLPTGAFLFPADAFTDQPERALVAEWIREKVLQQTRQEIPHAVAVVVERWNARPDGLVEIHAAIVVERDSQRVIVIGREGSLLRRIGTEARAEIEALLGSQVFLSLWVKVRPGWRDDERALRELGLGDALL